MSKSYGAILLKANSIAFNETYLNIDFVCCGKVVTVEPLEAYKEGEQASYTFQVPFFELQCGTCGRSVIMFEVPPGQKLDLIATTSGYKISMVLSAKIGDDEL